MTPAGGGSPGDPGPDDSDVTPATRRARARAAFTRNLRALLTPDGLPEGASAELESAMGDIGRQALLRGPGRLRRLRAEVAAAPPRLIDWISSQVVDHPAVVYDLAGVEQLAARQTRSIQTAVGALQVALAAAAAGSALEGGLFLALAVDGLVGQVAAVVHGVCDWYVVGSYVVRRLRAEGLEVEVAEVRRLTNAALVSRGATVDAAALARSSELRLVRRWSANGVVDALPFGSSLGRASARAVARIDASDLAALLASLRSGG